MAVPLYLDVHVPRSIAVQLRRRNVDVLTAIEDGCDTLPDEELLERARGLGRVLFTQDIRFKALAHDWQRQGRSFAGLLFGHQHGATLGTYVSDLEIVAKATQPADWLDTLSIFPFDFAYAPTRASRANECPPAHG
jgi:hypothetical protein